MEYIKSGGKHARSSGFGALSSDKHAIWRKSIKATTKFRNLLRQDKRILVELRRSRKDFIANHALTITVFDIVIDSSGLFTLASQYRFERLEWTLGIIIYFILNLIIIIIIIQCLSWK
jgi:hypothetical protein